MGYDRMGSTGCLVGAMVLTAPWLESRRGWVPLNVRTKLELKARIIISMGGLVPCWLNLQGGGCQSKSTSKMIVRKRKALSFHKIGLESKTCYVF